MIHVLLYQALSVRCYVVIQCDVIAPNKVLWNNCADIVSYRHVCTVIPYCFTFYAAIMSHKTLWYNCDGII